MNQNDLMQYGLPVLLVVGFLVFKRLGQISPVKAHELVKQGATLIDVRSASEFSSGHLPGAKNIPVGTLGSKVDSLGAKNKPIVLYCASGTRSSMARGVLKAQGFTQVYNLGAMGRW
jgi:rhodanese-related sulfurtransferase